MNNPENTGGNKCGSYLYQNQECPISDIRLENNILQTYRMAGKEMPLSREFKIQEGREDRYCLDSVLQNEPTRLISEDRVPYPLLDPKGSDSCKNFDFRFKVWKTTDVGEAELFAANGISDLPSAYGASNQFRYQIFYRSIAYLNSECLKKSKIKQAFDAETNKGLAFNEFQDYKQSIYQTNLVILIFNSANTGFNIILFLYVYYPMSDRQKRERRLDEPGLGTLLFTYLNRVIFGMTVCFYWIFMQFSQITIQRSFIDQVTGCFSEPLNEYLQIMLKHVNSQFICITILMILFILMQGAELYIWKYIISIQSKRRAIANNQEQIPRYQDIDPQQDQANNNNNL